jgi:sigma-E factor negative regulatory protein RseA
MATAPLGDKPGDASAAQRVLSVSDTDAAGMLRDPELDALLSAHRAMGGNSALQLPSGFLRNATFERPNQ